MATKNLPMKDICIDGGTQQRPVNDDVMRRYAALIKDGYKGFPPVHIITDGHNYFLVDGFHRYFSHLKLNKKYISATVEDGTKRDAQFFSFGANVKNAFSRQPGTVGKIIEKMLKDEKWSEMPQREIARYVGCTEGFVRKVKTEIEAHVRTGTQIEPDSEPKKEVSRSKTVKVKRGNSEYEAKVPEKKVLDSTGKQVPEHLVKYFERSNEYRQMIKQLNEMLKTVRTGKEAGDLFYKFIKIENLTAEIGNVKRIFRFGKPHAVCRFCGGDENNAECRSCGGAGFVNEMAFRATPEELK